MTMPTQNPSADLIPVFAGTIANQPAQLVDARQLYVFLESKRQFADWMKSRIEEYDFIENQDFLSFSQISEKPQGGRSSIEYHLTLDTAKEISMVEKNAKGRQARRYFIDCEKRLHEPKPLPHALRSLPAPDLELQLEGLEYKHQTRQLKIQTAASKARLALTMSAWIHACRPAGIEVRDLVAQFFSPQDSTAAIRDVLNRLSNDGKWQVQAVFLPRGDGPCTYYTDEELQALVEAKARAALPAAPPAPALPSAKPADLTLNAEAVQKLLTTALTGHRLLMRFDPDGQFHGELLRPEEKIMSLDKFSDEFEQVLERKGMAIVPKALVDAVKAMQQALGGE